MVEASEAKEKDVTDDHADTADSEGNLEPSVPAGLENPTEDPKATATTPDVSGASASLVTGVPAEGAVATVPGGISSLSQPSAASETLQSVGDTSDLQSGEMDKAVGDNREADPEADEEAKKGRALLLLTSLDKKLIPKNQPRRSKSLMMELQLQIVVQQEKVKSVLSPPPLLVLLHHLELALGSKSAKIRMPTKTATNKRDFHFLVSKYD